MQKLLSYKGFVSLIAFSLCFSLVIIPISVNASEAKAMNLPQEASQACADAEAQAQQDVNGTTWLAIGCLLGVTGWIIAMVVKSNPPASALVGKSPEYVAQYSDCYTKKAKEIKTKNALYGCLISTGAAILIDVLVIGAAASSSQ